MHRAHHKVVKEHHDHASCQHGEDGQGEDVVRLQHGSRHQHEADEDVGDAQDGQDGAGDVGVQAGEEQLHDGLAQHQHPDAGGEGQQGGGLQGRADDLGRSRSVFLSEADGHSGDDGSSDGHHQGGRDLIDCLHPSVVAHQASGGVLAEQQPGVLQATQHQGVVHSSHDGGGCGGDGDGDGQQETGLQNVLGAVRPLRREGRRGVTPGAQIVPGHVEQGGKLGDGDACDGARRADVVRLPQHPDEVPGQGQANDELEQGFDDLRHRRRGHVAVPLGVPAEHGQPGHQRHRRGQYPHTLGGFGVIHDGGEKVGPEEHDQGAEDAHRAEEEQGDPENLMGLLVSP